MGIPFKSSQGGIVQSLAVTAVVILLLAILGGPATFLLSRSVPRGRSLFVIHRIFTTLLGFSAAMMGFSLMIAHVSIIVRVLGLVGMLSSGIGLVRLYRRKSHR
jgi:ABC-type spermidine/putrescine transport system permease subunit I